MIPLPQHKAVHERRFKKAPQVQAPCFEPKKNGVHWYGSTPTAKRPAAIARTPLVVLRCAMNAARNGNPPVALLTFVVMQSRPAALPNSRGPRCGLSVRQQLQIGQCESAWSLCCSCFAIYSPIKRALEDDTTPNCKHRQDARGLAAAGGSTAAGRCRCQPADPSSSARRIFLSSEHRLELLGDLSSCRQRSRLSYDHEVH
jgi:hypothetical protein